MNMIGAIFDISLNGYLLLIVVFLVSRWLLMRKPTEKQPPGPLSLPIVGCLLSLQDTDLRKSLRKLAAKYGDVMQVDMGGNRSVVLNSYDVIKETILKQGHLYWARPESTIPPYQKELGLAQLNNTWTEQRRFTIHNLRDLGFGKNRMESIIADEGDNLIDEMKKVVNLPLNPATFFGKTSSNVIFRLGFGKRFSYDDPRLASNIQHFVDLDTILEKTLFSDNWPFMSYVYEKQVKAAFLKARDICLKWVQEKKETMNNDEEPTDYIDAFLKEIRIQEGRNDSSFTEEMLIWNLIDLYAAGAGTTAATLTFAIFFMTNHEEIQRKVQEEIDEVIGSHRRPVLQDRVNLPYTEAVISETQRLADVVPLGVPHSNTQDTTIRGYFIPRGSHIIINHHNVHRDPTNWPDPEKFDPGRFLDESGKYVKRQELIPFGLGKRNCLGESLARAELFLIFAGLMQHFTFQKVDGGRLPDTEGRMGLVVHPKPSQIVIQLRNGE